MGRWHAVNIYRAHRGTGRNDSVIAFIFAKDIIGVLDKYHKMPGVKRNPRGGAFPEIFPLDNEKGIQLEKRIMKERRIPLSKAKQTWYYDSFI